MQELSQATALNSKYIVKYFSCERRSISEVVLITEMTTRGPLNHYLRGYKNPKLIICQSWFRQILTGLEYLHSHNFVHGYLSCDHILVNSNSGEVKIGGLLLAKLQDIFEGKSTYRTKANDIKRFGLIVLEVGLMQTFKVNKTQEIMHHLFNTSHIDKNLYLSNIDDQLYCSLIETCLNANNNTSASLILQHPFFTTLRSKDEVLHGKTILVRGGRQENLRKSVYKKNNAPKLDVQIRILGNKLTKAISFTFDFALDTIDDVMQEMSKELHLSENCTKLIKSELEKKCIYLPN